MGLPRFCSLDNGLVSNDSPLFLKLHMLGGCGVHGAVIAGFAEQIPIS
jgi:hypothetical protein